MHKLTHTQYIAGLRHQAGQIANAIASGQIDVPDGCWELGPLLAQAELAHDDPDANIIALVCSELEGLPLAEARAHWAAEALDRLAPQLESAATWATSLAMPAIQSLALRYGAQVHADAASSHEAFYRE